VPLTGFWNRWRLKHLQPRAGGSKPPSLREAEKQRDAAERQVSEELAAIVTTASKPAKDSNRS
jgi:hypothetical protein